MERANHLPVTVCGTHLRAPRHICCFFDSREQQYDTLIPYFHEGLSRKEKVMTVMDSPLFDDHFRRLAAGGIDVAAAQHSGHLCTHGTDDTYLQGGRFDKERMLAMLNDELSRVRSSDFTNLRTCGDMSWTLRDLPGTEAALEYESDVNRLLNTYDATFMCLYDANRISGEMMLDVFNTHSHVLMGSIVYENPYFIHPDEYRKKLIVRRAATKKLLGSQAEPHE